MEAAHGCGRDHTLGCTTGSKDGVYSRASHGCGDTSGKIAVVDQKVEGNRATIVLDIKTSSNPRARVRRHLAGQIRTDWELRTGWVLRRWEIVNTENISMKYKDDSPPPPPPGAASPTR